MLIIKHDEIIQKYCQYEDKFWFVWKLIVYLLISYDLRGNVQKIEFNNSTIYISLTKFTTLVLILCILSTYIYEAGALVEKFNKTAACLLLYLIHLDQSPAFLTF